MQLVLPERVVVTGLGRPGDGVRAAAEAWARRWVVARAVADGFLRWEADRLICEAVAEPSEEDPYDLALVWPDGRRLAVVVP